MASFLNSGKKENLLSIVLHTVILKMASFLYNGKMEYLSSIVIHTVILKMLSKEAKSRNVASFLYSGIME